MALLPPRAAPFSSSLKKWIYFQSFLTQRVLSLASFLSFFLISVEKDRGKYSWQLIAGALLAVLVYNTSIGIVWAYMFLLGLEAGIAEQSVANVLTISQFLGIAGAFVAVLLQLRIGRIIPLLQHTGYRLRYLPAGRQHRFYTVRPGGMPV